MIIIPLLLCIIALIFFIMSNRILISSKIKKYFIVGYLTIIIISALTIYFIPKSNLLQITKLTNDYSLDTNSFKDLIVENKVNSSNELFKKFSWSFDYSNSTLKITDRLAPYQVICEKKSTNDEKIEVVQYVTPFYVNGVNVTDKVPPLSINLNKDELILYNDQNVNINMYKFEFDFPIKQFSETAASYNNKLLNFPSLDVIHIKVPKDCQITVPNYKQFEVIN
ncbi:hypothetical protein SAMN02745163_03950 [Clostridium cavendishii DSM 21758]|uniref:Uncharacterized protein n=1 Tax=Clostridium cavendishii DSM 21758 TaxID=1121302 RepID=A0A1M6T4U5_9CLOT|nr:hypothetical protein [Clostridium cavendishii]SHK52032.1 hypothetical protein SAMN02745163_03950 [Clostridium cavendishii DSM 21758]